MWLISEILTFQQFLPLQVESIQQGLISPFFSKRISKKIQIQIQIIQIFLLLFLF